ncbi:unnamed protein product, partial [Amoebophrya sp. A120]|eukprot:GSA120T00012164001.1
MLLLWVCGFALCCCCYCLARPLTELGMRCCTTGLRKLLRKCRRTAKRVQKSVDTDAEVARCVKELKRREREIAERIEERAVGPFVHSYGRIEEIVRDDDIEAAFSERVRKLAMERYLDDLQWHDITPRGAEKRCACCPADNNLYDCRRNVFLTASRDCFIPFLSATLRNYLLFIRRFCKCVACFCSCGGQFPDLCCTNIDYCGSVIGSTPPALLPSPTGDIVSQDEARKIFAKLICESHDGHISRAPMDLNSGGDEEGESEDVESSTTTSADDPDSETSRIRTSDESGAQEVPIAAAEG